MNYKSDRNAYILIAILVVTIFVLPFMLPHQYGTMAFVFICSTCMGIGFNAVYHFFRDRQRAKNAGHKPR